MSIKKLTEKEHLLLRPAMYIGSITNEVHNQYTINEDKFTKKEIKIVPGLIKILNELIDNSIDEFGRTNGKFATSINVEMTDEYLSVQDNGRGIPNTKVDGLYQAELAWCHARAGSNFDEQNLIGMNGIGSFATNVFSKKFIGVSDDGKSKLKIDTKNNLEDVKITSLKPNTQDVKVTTYPDFEKFGIEHFDNDHKLAIQTRLYHLSVSYPGIRFKFNKKLVKLNNKKYFNMFSENIDVFEYQDFSIGVSHNTSDSFENFSTVNGLLINDGGSHIDIISSEIVKRIRTKLSRRYKNLKPAEVKNRMLVIVIMKNFKAPMFNSQSKEKLTNPDKDVKQYLQEVDFDKISNKIYKNTELIDSITEFYKIKEEMQNRKDAKQLNKKKKIKSEKYLPATKNKKVLFLCEGDSAVGGLLPALGRDNFGFYALKGVPLNAYDAPMAKFTGNKELSEVYQIIQNEDYDYICVAADADSDGSHIKGLLIGFFKKYLSDYIDNSKFGELNTPVQAVIKNKKIVRWIYSLDDSLNLKAGEQGKYFKGLGSWKAADLELVVKKDGIENMIKLFNLDDIEVLDNWLNGNKADIRKGYLTNNNFDITGV